ncbi:MAG: hypothetical protein KA310_03465 [Pseudomonadales bacterium]|nr:hypothetical protein [Pseudomonadales bacterium]
MQPILKQDAPVCLSAEVELARGVAKPLDFDRMTSRSRDWLRIKEFRFFIDPQTQAIPNGLVFTADSLGALVAITANVGRHRITNDFVPLWMLGPRLSWRGEFSEQSYLVNGAGFTLPATNCYTWRLDKPMLVAPGTSLGMTVSRPVISTLLDPLSQLPNPFKVEVSAVGERLCRPPTSRETDIPYVTHFRTLPTTTTSLLQSGQYPLSNPFTKELRVERFNLRMAYGATAVTPGDATPFQDFLVQRANGNPDCRVRIYDGLNYDVTTETRPVPQTITGAGAAGDNPQGKVLIDTVFNPQWGTWLVNTKLGPKQWYTCEFAQSVNFGDNQVATEYAPMVAMVASRKEFV